MRKHKPVVVIQVEGGVASCQAVPPGSAEVVLIDWDSLKEGVEVKDALRDAKRLHRQVKALRAKLPDEPPGYITGVLRELKDTLDGLKEALESTE